MSSPRSATSTTSSTASSAASESDANRQSVLAAVTHLLNLTSTPVPATRLHAVLMAHSPSLTLTKTRRLTIMTKLRHRLREHSTAGDDSSWREVEWYIEQLTDSGQPVDRILSIVSYIMESSRPNNTNTAHTSTANTPLTATPAASVPSSPAPRSPPRASSALSMRGLLGGPSQPMTPMGASAGSVALSAPASMTHRTTPSANSNPPPSVPSIPRSTAPIIAPSPMRGNRAVMTPRVRTRQDETDERDAESTDGRHHHRNGHTDTDLRPALPFAAASSVSTLPISLLTRTAAESEMTDLCYGDQVTLQLPSGLFASIDSDFLPQLRDGSATSGTAPPLLHCLSPYPFVWTIVNAKTPIDRSAVRYLDSVSFTFDQMFLALSLSSSPSSSTPASLTLSAAASTASRFTLYSNPTGEGGSSLSSLSFLSVRGSVKHSDGVILKSASGQYLSGGQDDADDATGAVVLVDRPNVRSVMVMRKANLPLLTSDVSRVIATTEPSGTADWAATNGASLSSMSLAEQERVLVTDVLFALIGIDGEYVYRSTSTTPTSASSPSQSFDRRSFTVSPDVTDVSHRALLARLLPICDDYSVLSGYIATHGRHEYGRVQHTLTSTLSALHREYTSMIASLTAQPSLSLTQLSYHLSSPASTLHHLASLLNLTRHQLGGSVLTTLHNALLLCGDAAHRQLLLSLLSSASRPYMAMLQQWLYSGVLNDPYNEFQLHSNDNVTTASTTASAFDDSYWDSRFSLRHAQLPVFLQATADRVLTTGKYLNVIRECGRDGSVNEEELGRLVYSEQGERDYAAVVDQAYAFASRSLLSLLLSDYALLSHLSAIAHYFLFAHSDWYTQFVELAGEELERSMWAIQRERLQGLLQLAIKSARGGQAANSERLTCYLQPHSLMQKIDAMGGNSKQPHTRSTRTDSTAAAAGHIATGMDAFTLSYDVSYPLTLVLSKATMSKYQLLFRLLFNLKNAQRLLCSVWHATILPAVKRTPAMSSLLQLRQQMSHLLSCVLDYLSTQVLAPRSAALHTALQSASSLDAVITLHHQFLDGVLKLSLIVDRDVWQRLDAAVTLCKEVGRWGQDALEAAAAGELEQRVEVKVGWVEECVVSFELLMCRLCGVLRDKSAMGNEAHLLLLLSRLDYNQFYQRKENERAARHVAANQQPMVVKR